MISPGLDLVIVVRVVLVAVKEKNPTTQIMYEYRLVACSSALATIAHISQASPIVSSSVVDTSVVTSPVSEIVSGASIMGILGISAATVLFLTWVWQVRQLQYWVVL